MRRFFFVCAQIAFPRKGKERGKRERKKKKRIG